MESLELFHQKKREGGGKGSQIDISASSVRGKKRMWTDSSSIAPDERLYYQPDEYYVFKTHPGSPMNQEVVTFKGCRQSSYPSRGGIYVSEILLLAYCEKGKYPKSKSGYPSSWWFKYGIRNVGGAFKSLEERDFIPLAS